MIINNGLAYDDVSPSNLWLKLRGWLLERLAGDGTVIINAGLQISAPIKARRPAVIVRVEVDCQPDALDYAIDLEGLP